MYLSIKSIRPRSATTSARNGFARPLLALAAAMIAFTAIATASAEDRDISERRTAERKTFTDAEIIDGFLKTTFGAEFHIAGFVDRIRKYDGPVRVYIDNRARPDRRKQVESVVADISAHIRYLDIAMAKDKEDADVLVTLVRDRDLNRTIRRIYGRARARSIQRSLEPQCLSGFRKDETYRIVHSDVILVVDAGDFIFYDCAYEEMLQALGPINDTDSVPWTMFNDDVQMGFFDIFDQYILNILYDPRIRPGMTVEQVKQVLPQILPDVRAWVAKVNDLSP
jgi:hypothetical protein